MAADGAPIPTLIRLEAGLRAELDVLRGSEERDLKDDAREAYEFAVEDAQIAELKRAKEVLEEELAKARFTLVKRLRTVRELRAEESANVKARIEEEQPTEEERRKQLIALRKNVLRFAKEQWPVPQDEEVFEGGDFWEACVAACGDETLPIEYSDREVPFAELLIQVGVAERAEDKAGMKQIRLVSELYHVNELDAK